MTSPWHVGVAGASGYTGGELIRLLAGHPQVRLTALAAGTQAGRRLGEVHPSLIALGSQTLLPTTPETFADCDVVFLALPHGQSAALAERLPAATRVIDLGADFRLADADAWTRFYGGAHAGTWTYGLPELPGARDRIAASERVANPGCYPTSVALSLAPLLRAQCVERDDIVVVAASGTSGAGRTPKESLLATEVMGAMSPYKVGGGHQHTPEMEQSLSGAAGAEVTLSFTPTLAPMSRGILATCTARLASGVTATQVRDALATAYALEDFVHVLPEGQWPTTAAVLGSNSAHLQVAIDEHAGRVIVVAAIDNLIKGAAGQAVQNLNLMAGWHESTGLSSLGVAP